MTGAVKNRFSRFTLRVYGILDTYRYYVQQTIDVRHLSQYDD